MAKTYPVKEITAVHDDTAEETNALMRGLVIETQMILAKKQAYQALQN